MRIDTSNGAGRTAPTEHRYTRWSTEQERLYVVRRNAGMRVGTRVPAGPLPPVGRQIGGRA